MRQLSPVNPQPPELFDSMPGANGRRRMLRRNAKHQKTLRIKRSLQVILSSRALSGLFIQVSIWERAFAGSVPRTL
jgi:hypothetical protein